MSLVRHPSVWSGQFRPLSLGVSGIRARMQRGLAKPILLACDLADRRFYLFLKQTFRAVANAGFDVYVRAARVLESKFRLNVQDVRR